MSRSEKGMKKRESLDSEEVKLLNEICESTTNSGFLMVNENSVVKLVKNEYIELNNTMKDTQGRLAARATKEGFEIMESINKAEKEFNGEEVSSTPVFELEDNIPMPTSKRGGGRKTAIYPFAQMEVGQSFHVAKSDKMKNPARSLASTTSQAKKQFMIPDPSGATKTDKNGNVVPVMVATKVFSARAVDETDPKGPGVRVFRVK